MCSSLIEGAKPEPTVVPAVEDNRDDKGAENAAASDGAADGATKELDSSTDVPLESGEIVKGEEAVPSAK